MADISTELARILSAIYGEDVRGSIHDAIEKINDVSEVVLTTGTAVTGPSSSSTGFYDDSLYLNTDTFELWKCTGVNTWASQGILKGEAGDDGNGIVSIIKTSTSGLVDTYTITYTDGTTSTFNVTNGADGANGNKWYRGTGISGKAALPTVYTGSGVADANSGDMFLNPSEGAVYSCVTGGVPTVATWQYEMTLSGGSGGTSDYPDLTNKPSINGHTLLGNQTGADLGLANSSDIPTVDQTYNATSSNAQSGMAVASAISGKADTSLLKSTVGWTGKNYLRVKKGSGTVSGVNFVINDDGSVSVSGKNTGSGTAWFGLVESIYPISSGSYVLSGCPSGGSNNTYKLSISIGSDTVQDTGSGGSISVASDSDVLSCAIGISAGYSISGTLTFKPMLRDASITDDTYKPYHKSVEEEIEQIYADNGVLGAKNLLPITINTLKVRNTSGTWVNNVYTANGVTLTCATENGYVTKITADTNGVGASGEVTFRFRFTDSPFYPNVNNQYKLSGVSGGSASTYFMQYSDGSSSSQNLYNGEIEVDGLDASLYPYASLYISIKSGTILNNVEFYPMLRLASDPDDTYVPYAMTNRELTEEIANIVTDDWTTTRQVQSDGTVTFTGLNDSYSYSRPYYDLPSGESAYTYSKVTKSGSGTSVTLTYTTDAPSGTVCKLRILK